MDAQTFRLLPADNAILNTPQAAKVLNVTSKTLERWRKAGKGPKYVQLSERRVGYTGRNLREHVEANTVEPEPRS
jgi:predicted DNA-binding transcriptional regulator AlpA